MHHVAIMKKEWGLLEKIASGKKTCESRWYRTKRIPWNLVKPGDTLWFKNSGCPVTLKATVTQVKQFSHLDEKKTKEILNQYGQKDLGMSKLIPEPILRYFSNKSYCILVFFKEVEKVIPFEVDKKGFGAMSAWLSCPDIEKIRHPH